MRGAASRRLLCFLLVTARLCRRTAAGLLHTWAPSAGAISVGDPSDSQLSRRRNESGNRESGPEVPEASPWQPDKAAVGGERVAAAPNPRLARMRVRTGRRARVRN